MSKLIQVRLPTKSEKSAGAEVVFIRQKEGMSWTIYGQKVHESWEQWGAPNNVLIDNVPTMEAWRKGKGEFDAGGRLRKILYIEQLAEQPIGEVPYDLTVKPIWETISQIGEAVPTEEWKKVPSDLASRLDHYLYGGNSESMK